MLGRTETRTREDVLSVDTNSLRHLPRRPSKNCYLQFANIDRQTDRFKENYSIDTMACTCKYIYMLEFKIRGQSIDVSSRL